MATTSSLPTVKAQLVALLTTAFAGTDVSVSYAWTPNTGPEAVFLGRHPDLVANPLLEASTLRTTIPVMNAGRKRRQESYEIDVTIWSFRPDLRPEDAAEAEARGFEMRGELEDILADTPRLGLAVGVIQEAQVTDTSVGLVPFESGWASVLVCTVSVEARLT